MSLPFAYLPHRAVLALTGPDTLELLERLVTCNTLNWDTGEARYGALLTPQGKIIADFLAIRTVDGVLLDTDADALPDLAKRLKLFRLRAAVEIDAVEDMLIVAGIEPATDGVRPISGSDIVYLDPRYAGGRLRAMALRDTWRGFHGHEAEWSAPLPDYHRDRIAAGVPEMGADFGPAEVFPADVNMDRLGGVDYAKGCFVGQEVVSRMYRRGNIRKRTVRVAGEALTVGADLHGGGPLGPVTSLEGASGLARLRLDRVAKALAQDTAVTVAEAAATIDDTGPDWLIAEIEAFQSND